MKKEKKRAAGRPPAKLGKVFFSCSATGLDFGMAGNCNSFVCVAYLQAHLHGYRYGYRCRCRYMCSRIMPWSIK